MKKVIFFGLFLGVICFVSFEYKMFLESKSMKNGRKVFNVVLVGAAGSGKGTQADFLTKELNLLQISAGDVLRKHRSNPEGKYTKTINEYIDKGKLVPVEITNELMSEEVKEKVLCDNCSYNGVIFDGFPRMMEQLTFLDEFLNKNNNKIDAVVYLEIPKEVLIDRLSGRFSCAKCGELYHKTSKPTKLANTCDKCGGHEFKVREDDQNKEAIASRFDIFETTTKPVLEEYEKRGIVIKVNGNRGAKEIADEVLTEINKIKK